jgi:hypothetical protein
MGRKKGKPTAQQAQAPPSHAPNLKGKEVNYVVTKIA